MKIIALFFPAVMSVVVKNRRADKEWKMLDYVIEYAISVIMNVWFTTVAITYGLNLNGVCSDAFESFPFFTKYVAIAIILAFICPYIREIFGKLVTVSFSVGIKEDHEEDK